MYLGFCPGGLLLMGGRPNCCWNLCCCFLWIWYWMTLFDAARTGSIKANPIPISPAKDSTTKIQKRFGG
jgi:hypothetical protein